MKPIKNKIVSVKKLSEIISKLKNKKKIVHCHGVFDLVHVGHIKHFKEARSFGDILVVTLTQDKYINKGPNRPVFNEKLRAEYLSSLEIVDYIAINEWPTAVETIKILKPNFYCKGPDYRNNETDITKKIHEEIKAVKSIKGQIKYTENIIFSSSNLLNQFADTLSEKQKKLIRVMPYKNFSQIKNQVDELKNLKVLVIGETIIDQYTFCEVLGKSGKDAIMMFKNLYTEQYAGGAFAVVKHLSQFCNQVTLLSAVGEKDEKRVFLKNNLEKNIKVNFIKKRNSPTIIKQKFLDNVTKNKLFGLYTINDDYLDKGDETRFRKSLKRLIPKHDLVILSDYGHGLISKHSAKYIANRSPFLAVNAQINAANIGHHVISKYNNFDVGIINEQELRHELRNREGNLNHLMKALCKKLKIENLIVTQGTGGARLYERKNSKFFYCPAFASKVVDKIGAGDAMMAITSLALKHKANKSLSLFLGSLAAAQSVEAYGNSKTISKTKLLSSIKHIMK